jgi:hypothetical protein
MVISESETKKLELEARVFVLERFVKRMLDPEGFGFAVTAEVRDEARVLLGMNRVETCQKS